MSFFDNLDESLSRWVDGAIGTVGGIILFFGVLILFFMLVF